jgi:hypothetical protein
MFVTNRRKLVLAFLLTSSTLVAQSTYGAITGTVTDPSSAVVRTAKVEATFGAVTQSQLVEQAGPRSIQLQLRLQF